VSYGELTALVRGSVARRIKARFGQVDRNGDGRCTRSEVNKMSAERFARFDLNRDGHFTAAELATVITRQVADRLQRVYARLDADHNGAFTVAELTLPTKTSAPEAEVVATKKSRAQKQPVQVAKRGPGAVQ
jgi:Ca2+-binding EF-hand superfamily protein